MHCQCSDTNIYRVVCLIDEGDSFLLTGGRETPTKVSRYTQYSWQEDLSDLNSGRIRHACGWFTDTGGRRVRCNLVLKFMYFLI